MLIEANILPAGLWHPTAPSLFTILHLLRPLVLFLGLPWGAAEEVPDALLPGGCGTGAHGVTTCVLVLCCRFKMKHKDFNLNLNPKSRRLLQLVSHWSGWLTRCGTCAARGRGVGWTGAQWLAGSRSCNSCKTQDQMQSEDSLRDKTTMKQEPSPHRNWQSVTKAIQRVI